MHILESSNRILRQVYLYGEGPLQARRFELSIGPGATRFPGGHTYAPNYLSRMRRLPAKLR